MGRLLPASFQRGCFSCHHRTLIKVPVSASECSQKEPVIFAGDVLQMANGAWQADVRLLILVR